MIGETKLCIKQNTCEQHLWGETIDKILTGNKSPSHLYLSLAPKTINSVLSGFSLSLFSDIQP